ncbi:MAG: adenylate/guanylate cyclase domain-containing protein [Dehalococcoidia bacterium]|nr:adenylate/guanylate cyclase domain-containing protein [Dehalococcoidia bacterium]
MFEVSWRELLKANGGTEVKTMGDGFMASFGSVTRGVECAIALQRGFAERNAGVGAALAPPQGAASGAPTPLEPLHIRIGLNAGEPIEEEGPDGRSDLFGSTVILAARIASQAEGGEVLASMAVRELCAGKGFLFADRGEHVLRGFEDPVRMFEVHWRE